MPRAAPVKKPSKSHEATVEALRALIRRAVPSASEDVKWNSPNFRVPGGDFATLNLTSKTAVRLILHLGATTEAPAERAEIPDEAGLLEWRGNDRAIVSFADAKAVAAGRASLKKTIAAWARLLDDAPRKR